MMEKEHVDKSCSGTINGHEYVDLGLSVKWATCNVGASAPEDYGDYFAWGETKPKSEYTEENSVTFGKEIEDIAGNPNYDAARANWGGTWRMPTIEEVKELLCNCTTEWVTQNGVNGRLVTSKKNGNSIFLPAAGHRIFSKHNSAGKNEIYWSSSPCEGDATGSAYYFGVYIEGIPFTFNWNSLDRNFGLSVRPVSE